MLKKQRQHWFPMKVQPWTSITVDGIPCVGPEGSFGFIPVYDTEEIAKREFPDDEIRWVLTEVSGVKPKPRRKARGKGR